ncbi:hypothetical protein SNE40_018527 [Patella caerulea]|uniref:Uncharacterized protein n=1 Tax=Patella caerulea TaxID=87958 RepID=A0AAN8PGP9_PATCE
MFRIRRSTIFPCKTNELLLALFILWSVVFIFFWQWKNIHEDSHSNQWCQYGQQQFILKGNVKKTLDVTPVYIVEEHHEVLPYWFRSSERNLIPKQGNVLLHIDGHSDGAPPPVFDIISLFQYPRTRKEITAMMQQNDVFIALAAQAGLISRYIWVWPPWESSMVIMENDHVQFNIRMGLLKGLSPGDKYPVCVCLDFIQNFRNMTNYCVHLNDLMDIGDTRKTEIPRDTCEIKRTTVVELVSEDKALELSRSDNWLSPLDNIILDIDEDYYGCEAAIMPLYDVGMTSQTVDVVSEIIQLIFCPSNAGQESQLNSLFYDLIQKIKLVKQLNQRKGGETLDGLGFKKNASKVIYQDFYDTLKNPFLEKSVCKKVEYSLKKLTLILVNYLFRLTVSQLIAVSKVGLCLPVSQSTYEFSPDMGMRLCVGFNRPNRTMVIFHTPTMREIEIRTANMRSLLKNVPAPSVVTVCRSMRDGYTPVKYFSKIEKDVLNALINTYEKISFDSIHYDSDLLGGKPGLPERHFVVE